MLVEDHGGVLAVAEEKGFFDADPSGFINPDGERVQAKLLEAEETPGMDRARVNLAGKGVAFAAQDEGFLQAVDELDPADRGREGNGQEAVISADGGAGEAPRGVGTAAVGFQPLASRPRVKRSDDVRSEGDHPGDRGDGNWSLCRLPK